MSERKGQGSNKQSDMMFATSRVTDRDSVATNFPGFPTPQPINKKADSEKVPKRHGDLSTTRQYARTRLNRQGRHQYHHSPVPYCHCQKSSAGQRDLAERGGRNEFPAKFPIKMRWCRQEPCRAGNLWGVSARQLCGHPMAFHRWEGQHMCFPTF